MPAIGHASWEAIGTNVHVLVTRKSALEPAMAEVRALLDEVDRTYSRFRADSELTALNSAAGRATRVSPLLFEAIQGAIRAARATGGAIDPTIGFTLQLLGYDRDFAALPAQAARQADAALPADAARLAEAAQAPKLVFGHVPGWQTIELDPADRTVRMPARVSLDLGSTGKALASDLAAAAVHARTGSGVLVSLGGDIATAGEAPAGGWRIHCSDDSSSDPNSPGEVIGIVGGAIATSSTTVRRWIAGGVERHHIVDPATGLPASGPWRTVTVAAATCVDANAASTAAIVLGDRAIAWLRAAGLPARLVHRDGTVVRVSGWPERFSKAA
jgi:FAD:protein FMN transferase